MSHPRKQIRDGLAVALAGLTTTGANVFMQRPDEDEPLQDSELPGLIVETGDDEVVARELGGVELHELEVIVTAKAKGADAVDEADQASLEVEQVLRGGDPLSLGVGFDLVSTTPAASGELEADAHEQELRWIASYRVAPADAETIL